MKTFRIGLVGMGFIADWHYQGFAETDAEIIGMTQDLYGDDAKMSAMRKQLEDKCSAWNIKAYENFDAIVNDPAIDALVIGSVNPYHYDQIMKALEKGKHLLVEKPVVTQIGQLDTIEKKAEETGLVVFPAHNFVYRPDLMRAKKTIESGGLGKIVYASFISSHTISEAHAGGWRGNLALSAGGALMDSGHHLVYQSVYLMGMPVKIQAFTSNLVLKQMEGEDIAQVNLIYPDSSIGLIMQSWTSNHGADIDGIKIIGTESSLAVTEVDYAATFQQQAAAFLDAVENGSSPLSDLNDARDTLRLIRSAYESAEKNQVVDIF